VPPGFVIFSIPAAKAETPAALTQGRRERIRRRKTSDEKHLEGG
jgi:hypothetical protein